MGAVGGLALAVLLVAWRGSNPSQRSPAPTVAGETVPPIARTTANDSWSPKQTGPCLGAASDQTVPVRFTAPLAGSDVRAGSPVRVAGENAPAGVIVQLTTGEGDTVSAAANALGDFTAEVTFAPPTQPQGVAIRAAAAGQDRLGASYCGAPLGAVAFTLLPGADMSIWSPAGSDLSGPPFIVSGATAGAIASVQVRLERPDGSLIDERTVSTAQAANGDHTFHSPPLSVNRSDLGPAVLIVTWIDPRTGGQAPELVERIRLGTAAAGS